MGNSEATGIRAENQTATRVFSGIEDTKMPADINDEAPKQFTINPNATPAEIIAVWRAQLQANGEDVDDAFVEKFLGKM
jgi:hypothetical protein